MRLHGSHPLLSEGKYFILEKKNISVAWVSVVVGWLELMKWIMNV